MEKIIGLKQFREDVQKIAESVAKGQEYVVVKRSRPLFRIVSANVPDRRKANKDVIEAWKKLAGGWKGKKIEDPVKWQRRIRSESERIFTSPD